MPVCTLYSTYTFQFASKAIPFGNLLGSVCREALQDAMFMSDPLHKKKILSEQNLTTSELVIYSAGLQNTGMPMEFIVGEFELNVHNRIGVIFVVAQAMQARSDQSCRDNGCQIKAFR